MPGREHRSPDWTLVSVLIPLFFLAGLFNVWHHAMWRDELRTWQVCAATPSFADTCRVMRYDAVPVLWNAMVWCLTRLTANAFSMQVLHVAIASAMVFVVAAFAPFTRPIRVLFAFGYFPFFEYATITRNYALVFLCLMVACAILSSPRHRPILLAVVLTALTQVSIWGVGFAVLLLATAVLRWVVLDRRAGKKQARFKLLPWVIGIAMVLAGIVACVWEVRPGPAEFYITRFSPGTSVHQKLELTLATVWKGWVPAPEFVRFFWNKNILDPWPLAQGILGALLLAVALLALLRRPVALALLLCGVMGLMIFTFTQFKGFTRHHGHLFMLLIAASWLAATTPRIRLRVKPLNRISTWLERRGPLILLGLLAIHAIIGVGVNIVGVFLPFSAASATADYLRETFDENQVVLAGVNDFDMAPISAYLGRPIYSFDMERFATYNTQAPVQRHAVTPQNLMRQISDLSAQYDKDVVLIVNFITFMPQTDKPIMVPATRDTPERSFRIERLPAFLDATVGTERYALFRFRRLHLATSTAPGTVQDESAIDASIKPTPSRPVR